MGDAAEAILTTDVTEEILGERRAEWRDGYESGLKAGVQRTLQSHALEDIAMELKMLRTLYGATCAALADAQSQVSVLEAELDYRAPGWDRVAA